MLNLCDEFIRVTSPTLEADVETDEYAKDLLDLASVLETFNVGNEQLTNLLNSVRTATQVSELLTKGFRH